jgi:hypothetical protein
LRVVIPECHEFAMIVTLRKTDATNSVPRTAAITVDSAEHDPISERDGSGRKLRNRIILANVIAWIAIAVAIRLTF